MTVRFAESRIDAVERTSGGLLKVNAYPTRVGVFTYRRADGTTVRELRHPDEVFHADSLASLEDVAVTIRHPASQKVDPRSHASANVGHVRAGSVSRHDDNRRVRASLVLARQDAIEAAERKTHPELSAGYTCKIDPTPGVFEGERYDQAQTEIRYNHVAMLPPGEGRAGRECRLDAAGEEIPPSQAMDEAVDEPMKITINGKTYENEADLVADMAKLAARADAAEAQVKDLTAAVARHDAAAAQTRRDALVERVRSVMGKDFAVTRKDASGAEVALTDRELRCAVIRRTDSSFDDKDKADVYVEARFDATFATASKTAVLVEALNGRRPEEKRADSNTPASDDPRALHDKAVEDARKKGISV